MWAKKLNDFELKFDEGINVNGCLNICIVTSCNETEIFLAMNVANENSFFFTFDTP